MALLPGISRDGIVTGTGMTHGLTREDTVRFSFLLSAPVILAAGALKIPDLMGPLGTGVRGQVLAGSLLSGIGAYLSVRILVPGHYRRPAVTAQRAGQARYPPAVPPSTDDELRPGHARTIRRDPGGI